MSTLLKKPHLNNTQFVVTNGQKIIFIFAENNIDKQIIDSNHNNSGGLVYGRSKQKMLPIKCQSFDDRYIIIFGDIYIWDLENIKFKKCQISFMYYDGYSSKGYTTRYCWYGNKMEYK